MIDWSACPAVTSRPGFLAGKPALRADPRVPPEVVIDNMDMGESAQDVIANYDLKTPLQDVLAVYNYAKRYRGPHAA
jgi:uncharacterized protein (DUF433 family)